nr:MAG TPA: hypothetical protein [Caudoviricetes sp.]
MAKKRCNLLIVLDNTHDLKSLYRERADRYRHLFLPSKTVIKTKKHTLIINRLGEC